MQNEGNSVFFQEAISPESTKRAEPAFTSAEACKTSGSRSRGRSRAISNAPNKRQPYGRLLAASGILLAVVLVSALMTTFLQAPNLDALADAIYGLVEYPALAEMATEKGLGEVTNLKWENAAGEVANVYRSLL